MGKTNQGASKKFKKFTAPKLKDCAYCGKARKIFKNTPEGPQCRNCYNYDRACAAVHNKTTTKKRKMVKQSPVLEADAKTSLLVRKNYMVDDTIKCFTCDTPMEMRSAQCGHFIPRSNMATRWLLDNLRPQCHNCNVVLLGNLKEFEKRLELEIPGITDKLRILGKQVYKPSDNDVREICDDLKKQLSDIIKNERVGN